ncbi:MAG TPA: FliM/FliN family flagellar motor switch protein [Candidatus Acidoferrales bacterium]|nr:FliM/FliN family flagellar motor switch protein [Candidatus Acidoferrales bacterium]
MDAGGDILSREEIMALVRNAARDSSGPHVAPFDLAADDPRTSIVLPTLETLARNFAERLERTLTRALRHGVAVAVRPAVSHGSAAAALATLGAVSTAPLRSVDPDGVIWIAIETSWLTRMVDTWYGGSGKPTAVDYTASLAAMRAWGRLVDWARSDLSAAWSPHHAIELSLAEAAMPASTDGTVEPAERVLLQPFALRLADHEAELVLVFPLSVLARMAPPKAPGSISEHHAWQRSLGRALGEVPVMLSARLAEVQLTMGELLALRNGDVLPLGEPDRVRLYLEDRFLIGGELGTAAGRKVVRLRCHTNPLDNTGKGAI